MMNWGVYGFPKSEPTRIKTKRLFYNAPPHIESALSYYTAENAFKDTSMTQPCSYGDDVVRLYDLSPAQNTMIAGGAKPKFVIDNGFPCIQTNGIPLTGNVQYSAQYHFAVFRAPGSTFAGYGSCLGTVPNNNWPYLFFNGRDSLYTHSSLDDTQYARKNGQSIADPYASGSLYPIDTMMVLFVRSDSTVVSNWQFGAQGVHKAPLYIYEAANYSGLSEDQINEIEAYLLSKYKI